MLFLNDANLYASIMISALVVFLGAGLGAVVRHFVNGVMMRALGNGFPWGIFFINVSGSLIMGLVAGFLAFRSGMPIPQPIRLFLTTGILGGYTTFSAFSLDAALLWERGAHINAALYVIGSVGLSIAGLFLGLALIRALT